MFFFFFLFTYALLFFLVWRRFSSILPKGKAGKRIVFWAWLGSILLLVVSRMLSKAGLLYVADWMGFFGYQIMGVLLIFFPLVLLSFILEGLCFFLARISPLPKPGKKFFPVLTACATLLVAAFAAYEAANLTVTEITITTDKIRQGKTITLAHTTDFHLQDFTSSRRLARAVALIKEYKPDIWVDTGDAVDSPTVPREKDFALFHAVNPALGKYFAPGNHEHIRGRDRALQAMSQAGFTILAPGARQPDPDLVIVGIDDFGSNPFTMPVLQRASQNAFVIFLKHRPGVLKATQGYFDLQLSGHTHGGQIWPYHYAVEFFNGGYLSGLYALKDGARLYVSRGTGIWGPQMKLFSPPELVMITLKGGMENTVVIKGRL